MIPFADSEELVSNSGLPKETLIEVGDDHRLSDPEPLKAMLTACEQVTIAISLTLLRLTRTDD